MSGSGGSSVRGEPVPHEHEKAFTSYDIQSCLYDVERVALFQAAISAVVKPGDVVVDGGSGTGLLGMLAARAGAARVYCVEINDEYVEVIRENARRNGLDGQIVAIRADATTVDLPEQVDVIVSEVISAGFFYEPQLQIVGNLRRFLKAGGAVIPYAMENHVELIDAQERLYGLTFTYDTRFRGLDDTPLTGRSTYLATVFDAVRAEGPFEIARAVRTRAEATGRANAIRVGYRIQFVRDGDWAERATEFLLNPQIIFLREAIDVQAGERYEVSLRYRASASPLSSTVSVHPVEEPSGGRVRRQRGPADPDGPDGGEAAAPVSVARH